MLLFELPKLFRKIFFQVCFEKFVLFSMSLFVCPFPLKAVAKVGHFYQTTKPFTKKNASFFDVFFNRLIFNEILKQNKP